MTRFLAAVLVLVAAPAFAGTYVWNGAVSDRFSDDANWSGGSPATDPRAELSFPAAATRRTATNDLPNLTVRGISISGDGYAIGGLPIRLAGATVSNSVPVPATITCDLIVDSAASFVTPHGAELILNGRIGGSGTVSKSGEGSVTFGGSLPNDYEGATRVTAGLLRLLKPANVIAIPGNLEIDGEVMSFDSGQIASTSAVSIGAYGVLRVARTETIASLVIARGGAISMSADRSGTIRYTGTLILGGDVHVTDLGAGEQAQIQGRVLLPATRTITVDGGLFMSSIDASSPGAGLILRGAGFAVIGGSYTGPTIIDGPTVDLRNVNTAVTMRNGAFQGNPASIVAERGTVSNVFTPGALRLGSAATLQVILYDEFPSNVAGSVSLDNAMLELITDELLEHRPGAVYRLLQTEGSGPIAGIFAGMAEGTIIGNRFRISYAGGAVTLTDISRYVSHTELYVDGELVRGGTVTLHAFVSWDRSTTAPGGTVTFREGNNVIGTAPIDANGVARTTFIASRDGDHVFTARFEGDAATDPSEDSKTVTIASPPPVITSVEPTSVRSGETATLIVRGTNFNEHSEVVIDSSSFDPSSFSATELRLTWTAPQTTETYEAGVRVRQIGSGEESNVLPLTIVGVPATPPVLTFEERAIRGTVTPGASSAWLRGSQRRINFTSRFEREYGVVVDSDNDGSVTWPQADVVPPGSTVVMVDMRTGTINAGRPDNTIPEPMPFPITFLRDANGVYTHIVTEGRAHWMLWVRPNVGAWKLHLEDYSPLDANPLGAELIGSTTAMEPLPGSPAPPTGIERGDIFAGLYENFGDWYGARVDDYLGTGPGVIDLASTLSSYEGDGSWTGYVFRREGSDGAVSVNYATANDTAIAGVHYEATAGTVTFGAGELVKRITIPLIDDETFSDRTAFKIRLSDPVGATIESPAEWTIVIHEDDPEPRLNIPTELVVQEGDSGMRQVTVTATLTGSTRLPVHATWRVDDEDGNSTYTPLTFAPGETTKSITVGFTANTISEEDRFMTVGITSDFDEPVRIENGYTTITIRDDDPYPTLAILDASVSEAEGRVRLTVLLTGSTNRPISFHYTTANGSAVAGTDYVAQSGTLNGQSVIDLDLIADSMPETTEWFSVILSNPQNANLGRATALVTIADDDTSASPVVSIADASVFEGDSGTTPMRFTVHLQAPRSSRVRVNWQTADGTADRADYAVASGEVVFEPGETAKTITVNIHGDRLVEQDETFTVQLTAAVSVTITNAVAMGTIRNDEGANRNRAVR